MLSQRLTLSLALLALLSPGQAAAHWCSNIFVTKARIVVKPEKDPVVLSGTPTPFRVYLQNNFPYKIRAYMRATSGTTINPTTPSSGYHDVHPGQNVSFVFTLTGSGSTAVSTLNLQMKFRTDGDTNPSSWTWRGTSDGHLNQSPAQSALISDSSHGQSGSLSAAMLAEKFPSATLGAGQPWFGRTGIQALIKWFGYRFCWDGGGSWRCGSQDCPSPCAEGNAWTGTDQFPQLCMRAGAEVGARKALLGSNLDAARQAAINAMQGGHDAHKCLAAVVGGYLWQGASAGSFTAALGNVTTICQNAGLRALGQGTSSACTSGQYYERAACAAGEGIANNDGPVASVLMPNAGDGTTGASGYNGLYYSYLLYLVQAYRKDVTGHVPFYPDAGTSGTTTGCLGPGDCNDGNPCTTDACNGSVCSNTPISGCCTSAAQCDDGNPCTADTCDGNTCGHAPISGCCTAGSQCSDGNPCTSDLCQGNVCSNPPISGCCTTAAQCDDGSDCTADSCDANVCGHVPIAGCCKGDPDCVDNDPCTVDTCDVASGNCSNAKQADCCTYDTDCNDGDGCTLDRCDPDTSACSHTFVCGIDSGVTPVSDGFSPWGDGGAGGNRLTIDLVGGCALVTATGADSLPVVLLLLGLVALVGRRRGRRPRRW